MFQYAYPFHLFTSIPSKQSCSLYLYIEFCFTLEPKVTNIGFF